MRVSHHAAHGQILDHDHGLGFRQWRGRALARDASMQARQAQGRLLSVARAAPLAAVLPLPLPLPLPQSPQRLRQRLWRLDLGAVGQRRERRNPQVHTHRRRSAPDLSDPAHGGARRVRGVCAPCRMGCVVGCTWAPGPRRGPFPLCLCGQWWQLWSRWRERGWRRRAGGGERPRAVPPASTPTPLGCGAQGPGAAAASARRAPAIPPGQARRRKSRFSVSVLLSTK
jgi:hypothetical protein